MNLTKIKILIYIFLLGSFQMACKKGTQITETSISKQLIVDKVWALDYSVSAGKIKNYIGQTTYEVIFFNNDSTRDSDGLIGTFRFQKNDTILQLIVKAVTLKQNTVNYLYKVETIGEKKLILSYDTSGIIIKHYYSSK